jgi:hypothetical protein
LVEFYNTDFGAWFPIKSGEYNQQAQINFEKSYKKLSKYFLAFKIPC